MDVQWYFCNSEDLQTFPGFPFPPLLLESHFGLEVPVRVSLAHHGVGLCRCIHCHHGVYFLASAVSFRHGFPGFPFVPPSGFPTQPSQFEHVGPVSQPSFRFPGTRSGPFQKNSSNNILCDSGISGPSYSSIASRILFQPGFRSGVSIITTTTLPNWPIDE